MILDNASDRPVCIICFLDKDHTWMMLLLELLESVLTKTVKKGEVR